MKIAVQTGGVEERLGLDGAYRLIREAGFDGVDANVDHLMTGQDYKARRIPAFFLGSDADCIAHFKPWKDAAEKYGLDNYQAHAPFPSYVLDPDHPDFNDALIVMLRKTIMGCDSIGCRNLVVHPFFLGYRDQMDPETEWRVNIERYSMLIPEAKKYGVTICLENMFSGYRGKLYNACCSDIPTACKYIDTLNDIAGQQCFAFCLDTGHLLLMGKDIKNTMIQLGDRIRAFHVHDNNGIDDQHLAPFMGVQDWSRFVDGLRAIGFDRTMSFETFNIWNTMNDPELSAEMLRFIAKAGRAFAQRAKQA
ncbi:MAG: sugar phosphate isomerase/epimerase [Eubacteriales bacterium]|nr:sugar phosphate isomerase/epimerase [Eubacteriales bacterium]